jgi:hypothetical protein
VLQTYPLRRILPSRFRKHSEITQDNLLYPLLRAPK